MSNRKEEKMNITDVKIRKYENNHTKAFASVTMDDALVITGITIIEGNKGLFVSMPQTKGKDKDGKERYFDIVFPTTKEGRDAITDSVLEAYEKEAGTKKGIGKK